MAQTLFLNLTKPDLDSIVDIKAHNANMDKIDKWAETAPGAISNIESKLVSLEAPWVEFPLPQDSILFGTDGSSKLWYRKVGTVVQCRVQCKFGANASLYTALIIKLPFKPHSSYYMGWRTSTTDEDTIGSFSCRLGNGRLFSGDCELAMQYVKGTTGEFNVINDPKMQFVVPITWYGTSTYWDGTYDVGPWVYQGTSCYLPGDQAYNIGTFYYYNPSDASGGTIAYAYSTSSGQACTEGGVAGHLAAYYTRSISKNMVTSTSPSYKALFQRIDNTNSTMAAAGFFANAYLSGIIEYEVAP